MDPAALRAAFPVFERLAYLNAGTCGPVPQEAVRAQAQAVEAGARAGRGAAYFEQLQVLRERQRAAYAALVGSRPEDIALQTSTSEGIVRVLVGLGLGFGDEVLTVADEHPGLLGPLAAARERLGLTVRTAALHELPFHVGPRTRLVACSHVAWTTGELAPALAEVGRDVPVLLDGAQGAGAVPVDAAALGCAFYA
ncbi:MAG: aminotransferase class V-fold PLP-dependent enzyme, partial [Actinomycetota bacterium]|nr:aminotransferase class V-fold PLP-dependent enzyme [Actinomycetota bacterium]